MCVCEWMREWVTFYVLESTSTSRYLHTRLMPKYSVYKQLWSVEKWKGTNARKKDVCWLLKWAKPSKQNRKDRRVKSANLLKTSQVFLILKMSHCAITFIHSSNADAIQLNDTAVEIKLRFSGFQNAMPLQ